jgi:5-hydroxyisourate hydrolase-like protein (transthyretin family)
MKGLLTVFVSIVISTALFSQDYNVRGFLFDKDNGEPVAFAKLILEKEGAAQDAPVIGATSDLEGFFNFAKLEKGTYTLSIKTMEYVEITDQITLDETEIVTLRYELEKADEVKEVEEINVYADDRTKRNQVEMSVIKLDKKGLERIPSMGAENDITAALSVTPGVVTTGDQGGQIYVRGGTPIQNKILLDGMTIYNPFHSIGFFSVFETELIKSADIYTGGFASDYGGRIASIMDITYRDGNMKKFGG